jgi:hypothetical protein
VARQRALSRNPGRFSALQSFRDAEVEQLREQLSGALDHHDVSALDVAVHDPELVCRMHDLAQTREQRPEQGRRHRPPSRN